MAINTINIGAVANDGTGDPIRTAFDTVNENFSFVQGGLFAGTESSIISAASVQTGYLLSNTYIYATTYANANTIVSRGNTIVGSNLLVQSNGATIFGNVTILGNLTVSGTQAAGAAQSTDAAMLNVHYPTSGSLVVDDSKDIGLTFKYYKGTETQTFLGWQNSTRTLVWMDNVTETAGPGNIIASGTFGNVKFGSLTLSNTTVSTSNVTGALQVVGGAGVQGNVYIQSNLFVGNSANVGNLTIRGNIVGSAYFGGTDTVYINGSPVVTSATAFAGGAVPNATQFNDLTAATSTTSGAVTISGGLGVAGNVFLSNLTIPNSGNVRANIQGNVFTASQPYITSLGTLTGLTMSGQLNTNDISPNSNNTYNLGTGTSDRWLKIWAFDIDMSGTLTGGTVNGTGGTHTGNIAINTATAAALTSTTAVGELFESGPTTIRIGGGGTTQFRNNTKATSTSTGAVVVTGGLSLTTGNLYIGGSAGNAIVATGAIHTSSNTQATSTTSGALQVTGGASLTTGNLYIGGSGGNSIVATGNIGITGHILPFGANITYNLGSTTQWWNTFYGISTQAQYADLAEKYTADAEYDVGTVVIFGGEQEITISNTFADTRVAGVISHNPAYLMNAASEGLSVALRGRVPVKIIGAVSKGDLLVTSSQEGFAQSVGQSSAYTNAVFAKSLTTDGRNGSKIIEAVIL
jgi:hypothetical protein